MRIMFITGSCRMRDDQNNLMPFVRSQHFIKIFTMFGDELIYPKIYWYEGDYLFNHLEKIIEKKRPDMIIGYSAGGYLGFHLCNKYKLKGLHFNPAIASSSEAPTLQKLPENYFDIPIYNEQTMIIGEKDRKWRGGVDAHLVVNYLENINFNGEILIIPELEHDVPLQLFKMVFEYFREIYFN